MQSLQLDFKRGLTEFGQPVVPSALVVGGASLLNQSVARHAIKRAVERSGAHLNAAALGRTGIFHDVVAVLVALRQRKQDREDGRGERCCRCGSGSHVSNIYLLQIYPQEKYRIFSGRRSSYWPLVVSRGARKGVV